MRESIIDSSFKRLLDTRKASARWKAYRKISSLVLADSWALFGVLVTLFLLLLFRFGLAATWPLAIPAVMFLSHNIYAFYRTHSVFYRNRGQERWKQIVLMVLTPTSSIRASDMTVRELFAGLHFLAIGRVLLGPAQSRELTSKTLREMLHPVEVAEEHSSSPASEWATERWTRIVSDWAEKEFGDLKELLAPPPKESARCIRYCPRCLTQYVVDQDNCADCPGIKLISF
jgi:hypothetical protein